MATNNPAPNGGTTSTSGAAPAQPAPGPARFFDVGHGIYLTTSKEQELFDKWLVKPNPGIEVSCLLRAFRRIAPRWTPALAAEVASTVTPEQNRRFSLVAHFLEIHFARQLHEHVKESMEDILEVLKAEQEDALADFDSEDFKRLEREDKA